MLGVNTAAAAVPWSKVTVPATGSPPRNSRTVDGVSEPPSTGSLNTTTIAALRG